MIHPEALVVGAVLREPDRRFALSAVRVEHFIGPTRAAVWAAVCALADADDRARLPRPIHPDRVADAYPDLRLDDVAKLWELGNHPSAVHDHIEHGDKIVARWQVRAMRNAYEDAVSVLAQSIEDDDARAGLDTSEIIVNSARRGIASADPSRGVRSPADLAEGMRVMFETFDRSSDTVTGVRSGWPTWDTLHGGSRPGRVAFTIAPTGTGKTSLMVSLLANSCDGIRADPTNGLYVNLEMMDKDIDQRLTAVRLDSVGLGMKLDDIKRGRVPTDHRTIVDRVAEDSGLYATGPDPKDINAICSLLGKHAVAYGMKIAVVDHLIEIRMTPEEKKSHRGEAWRCHPGWVSRMGAVARRYGFAVEIVGQCGREDFDFKAGKEPTFRNMQGGSALLNVVDTARILWTDKDMRRVVTLAKNRGGNTTRMSMAFDRFSGTWKDLGFYSEER